MMFSRANTHALAILVAIFATILLYSVIGVANAAAPFIPSPPPAPQTMMLGDQERSSLKSKKTAAFLQLYQVRSPQGSEGNSRKGIFVNDPTNQISVQFASVASPYGSVWKSFAFDTASGQSRWGPTSMNISCSTVMTTLLVRPGVFFVACETEYGFFSVMDGTKISGKKFPYAAPRTGNGVKENEPFVLLDSYVVMQVTDNVKTEFVAVNADGHYVSLTKTAGCITVQGSGSMGSWRFGKINSSTPLCYVTCNRNFQGSSSSALIVLNVSSNKVVYSHDYTGEAALAPYRVSSSASAGMVAYVRQSSQSVCSIDNYNLTSLHLTESFTLTLDANAQVQRVYSTSLANPTTGKPLVLIITMGHLIMVSSPAKADPVLWKQTTDTQALSPYVVFPSPTTLALFGSTHLYILDALSGKKEFSYEQDEGLCQLQASGIEALVFPGIQLGDTSYTTDIGLFIPVQAMCAYLVDLKKYQIVATLNLPDTVVGLYSLGSNGDFALQLTGPKVNAYSAKGLQATSFRLTSSVKSSGYAPVATAKEQDGIVFAVGPVTAAIDMKSSSLVWAFGFSNAASALADFNMKAAIFQKYLLLPLANSAILVADAYTGVNVATLIPSGTCGRAMYTTPQLSNVAVHPLFGGVFVAGSNCLFQLSPDLFLGSVIVPTQYARGFTRTPKVFGEYVVISAKDMLVVFKFNSQGALHFLWAHEFPFQGGGSSQGSDQPGGVLELSNSNGVLLVGSVSKGVSAFRIADGAILWSSPLQLFIEQPASASGDSGSSSSGSSDFLSRHDYAFFGERAVVLNFLTADYQSQCCLDGFLVSDVPPENQTKQQHWQVCHLYESYDTTVGFVAGGGVVYTAKAGYITATNAETGVQVWRVPLPSSQLSCGDLYLNATQSILYASCFQSHRHILLYSAESGKLIGSLELLASGSPAIVTILPDTSSNQLTVVTAAEVLIFHLPAFLVDQGVAPTFSPAPPVTPLPAAATPFPTTAPAPITYKPPEVFGHNILRRWWTSTQAGPQSPHRVFLTTDNATVVYTTYAQTVGKTSFDVGAVSSKEGTQRWSAELPDPTCPFKPRDFATNKSFNTGPVLFVPGSTSTYSLLVVTCPGHQKPPTLRSFSAAKNGSAWNLTLGSSANFLLGSQAVLHSFANPQNITQGSLQAVSTETGSPLFTVDDVGFPVSMTWIDSTSSLAVLTFSNHSIALVSVRTADNTKPVMWRTDATATVRINPNSDVLPDPRTPGTSFLMTANEIAMPTVLYSVSVSTGQLTEVTQFGDCEELQLTAIPGSTTHIVVVLPAVEAETAMMYFVDLSANPITAIAAPEPLNYTQNNLYFDLVYVAGTYGGESVFLVGQPGTAETGKLWGSKVGQTNLTLVALSASTGKKLWWLPAASFHQGTGYGPAPISMSSMSKFNGTLVAYGNMINAFPTVNLTRPPHIYASLKISNVATNVYWLEPPNVPSDIAADCHTIVLAYWDDSSDRLDKFLDSFVFLDPSVLLKSQIPMLPSYKLPTASVVVPLPSAGGQYISAFSEQRKTYIARMNSLTEYVWVRELPVPLSNAANKIRVLPAYGTREERVVIAVGNYILQWNAANGSDVIASNSLGSVSGDPTMSFSVYVQELPAAAVVATTGSKDLYQIVALGPYAACRIPTLLPPGTPIPASGIAFQCAQFPTLASYQHHIMAPSHFIPMGNNSYILQDSAQDIYTVAIDTFLPSWEHKVIGPRGPNFVAGGNMVYTFSGHNGVARLVCRLTGNGSSMWEHTLPYQGCATCPKLQGATDLKLWDNRLYALVSLQGGSMAVYVFDTTLYATAGATPKMLKYIEFTGSNYQPSKIVLTPNTSVHVIDANSSMVAYDAVTYKKMYQVGLPYNGQVYGSSAGILFVDFANRVHPARPVPYTGMYELATGKYLFSINVHKIEALHVMSSEREGITGVLEVFIVSANGGLVYDALPTVNLTGPVEYIPAQPIVQPVPAGYKPEKDLPVVPRETKMSHNATVNSLLSFEGFTAPKNENGFNTYGFGTAIDGVNFGVNLFFGDDGTVGFTPFIVGSSSFPSAEPLEVLTTYDISDSFPTGVVAVYLPPSLTPFENQNSFSGFVRAVNQTDFVVFFDWPNRASHPKIMFITLPASVPHFTAEYIGYKNRREVVVALSDNTVRCYQTSGSDAPKELWVKKTGDTGSLSPIHVVGEKLVLFNGTTQRLMGYNYHTGDIVWTGTAGMTPKGPNFAGKPHYFPNASLGASVVEDANSFDVTVFNLDSGVIYGVLNGSSTVTYATPRSLKLSSLTLVLNDLSIPTLFVATTYQTTTNKAMLSLTAWSVPDPGANNAPPVTNQVWSRPSISLGTTALVPALAVVQADSSGSLDKTYVYYGTTIMQVSTTLYSVRGDNGDALHTLTLDGTAVGIGAKSNRFQVGVLTVTTEALSLTKGSVVALYRGGGMVPQYHLSTVGFENSLYPTYPGCVVSSDAMRDGTGTVGCRLVPPTSLTQNAPTTKMPNGWSQRDHKIIAVGGTTSVAIVESSVDPNTFSSNFYALNSKTGQFLWGRDIPGLQVTYLWDDVEIFLAFTDRSLYLFNAPTGTLFDTIPLPECGPNGDDLATLHTVHFRPVRSGTMPNLFFSLHNNCLYRLDFYYALKSYMSMSGRFNDQIFFDPSGTSCYAINDNGVGYFFADATAVSFQPSWERPLGHTHVRPKAVVSERYMFVAFGSYVIATELPRDSRSTPKLAWMYNTEVEPVFLVPFSDMLLVGYDIGIVVALEMDPEAPTRRKWARSTQLAPPSSGSGSSDTGGGLNDGDAGDTASSYNTHQEAGRGQIVIVGTIAVVLTRHSLAGINASTSEVLWKVANTNGYANNYQRLLLTPTKLVVLICEAAVPPIQFYNPANGLLVSSVNVYLESTSQTWLRGDSLYFSSTTASRLSLDLFGHLSPDLPSLTPPVLFPTKSLPAGFIPPGMYTGVPTFPAGLTAAPLGCVLAVEPLAATLMNCLNGVIAAKYPDQASVTQPQDCSGWSQSLKPCVDGYLAQVPGEGCTAGVIYLNEVLQAANRSESLGFCGSSAKCSSPTDAHLVCAVMNEAQDLIATLNIPQSTLAPAQQLLHLPNSTEIAFPYPQGITGLPTPQPTTQTPQPTTQTPQPTTQTPQPTTQTSVPPTPVPSGTQTAVPHTGTLIPSTTPVPGTNAPHQRTTGLSKGAAAAIGIVVTAVVVGVVAGIFVLRRRRAASRQWETSSLHPEDELVSTRGSQASNTAGGTSVQYAGGYGGI